MIGAGSVVDNCLIVDKCEKGCSILVLIEGRDNCVEAAGGE